MPSTSAKQHRFMQSIAHNPSFAKKVGVKQSVGKDFAAADKGKAFNKGGMMAKVKRYNGATEDGSDIYSDRDENPEAQEVERRTSAGGVRMSPSYLTKPASAAPYRMSQADEDESARNLATIERDAKVAAANARDNDNRASNVASNKASSAYQNTMRKAAATNERQAAQARASDDGKDYSGEGLRTAGKAGEAVAAGALATAAMMKGQPLLAGRLMSKTAIPAAKQVYSVFRSNRNTGAERAGEGAARAVTKEADRMKNTPNTTATAIKPNSQSAARDRSDFVGPPPRNTTAPAISRGGRELQARERPDFVGPPAPSKTASAGKPGGKLRDNKGPTDAEMEKLVNEGKVALKRGGTVKKPKGMDDMKMGGMPMKFAHGGMKKGGMPMKDGKPAFMQKKMMGGGMAKFAKGGGIESRGKTKGTIIRMASGGSVSSASRRADGIAQRGKTKC